MSQKALVQDLRRIVGPSNVLDSAVNLSLYQYDAYLEERRPDAVVFVHSTDAAARLVVAKLWLRLRREYGESSG